MMTFGEVRLLNLVATGTCWTNPYMKTYLTLLLIVALSSSAYGGTGVTNAIAKELKHTMYTSRLSTVKEGYANRNKSALNCAGYAFRIKDIAKKHGKKVEIWQAGGMHLIVIVKDRGKRIAYSNGKVVRESAYAKLSRIKLK